MRYKMLKPYTKRVIKKFLFFPCVINREIRWLEFANIGQYIYDQTIYKKYWTNEKFIDSEEEKILYLNNDDKIKKVYVYKYDKKQKKFNKIYLNKN